jgi:hypothetical protein
LLIRKKQAEAKKATRAIDAKAWAPIQREELEDLTHRLRATDTTIIAASPV